MQSFFASEGLYGVTWLWVLAAGLGIFFVIELEKLIIRGKILVIDHS